MNSAAQWKPRCVLPKWCAIWITGKSRFWCTAKIYTLNTDEEVLKKDRQKYRYGLEQTRKCTSINKMSQNSELSNYIWTANIITENEKQDQCLRRSIPDN